MSQLPHGGRYELVEAALRDEFAGIHPASTVTRCIEVAHHGAVEVTGHAYPALVERIARKHLQVLAVVAEGRA
ncbi:hypothetical protein [Microtetraspora sp. NBRC 16547]|uniref:hypothetical protein n=1 Tax=Microtetraspora sp. NBRC 16547 TaxID=3030993 RepID=UPI0024A20F3F|nr:hypothetical protein [Microtetraspora sp. NBRC 16547]GLX01076.1 hypothetical protein Misp02_51620 [Microtetraspora sp. NBRC 16547]